MASRKIAKLRKIALRTIILLTAVAGAASAAAQETEARPTPPRQERAAQAARESSREQINENVLFLMSGRPGASYETIADDIAAVVDDGPRMRVLPVLGNAAAQNVSDVLFLRGVDLALTVIQVMNELKQTKRYGPSLDRQLAYITTLSNDEMHIVARPGINTIEDLQNKKVNFHAVGSASALLGPRVIKELQIDVQPFNLPQRDALQRMRAGEIDATVCICAKPVTIFADLPADSGFRLIAVPYASALRNDYLPATIGTEDYPNLLPSGAEADTIATTTALISLNWPRGSARYNRIARFVDVMFSKFSEFHQPPRHPMWRSVNLAAVIPGWHRFPAAQEWLDRHESATASLRPGLARILGDQATGRVGGPTAADNDKMFREFMDHMRKARN
jgi:uncharacterized protein